MYFLEIMQKPLHQVRFLVSETVGIQTLSCNVSETLENKYFLINEKSISQTVLFPVMEIILFQK